MRPRLGIKAFMLSIIFFLCPAERVNASGVVCHRDPCNVQATQIMPEWHTQSHRKFVCHHLIHSRPLAALFKAACWPRASMGSCPKATLGSKISQT